MFPSSLNIKRKAACAANCKITEKNISKSEDIKIIEENYYNKQNIESFLRKQPISKINSQISTQIIGKKLTDNKKSQKVLKDLPKISNEQYIIIENDSEDSNSDEIYLKDSSSKIHSPLKSDGHFAQSSIKQNDSFQIKNYINNLNIEKQNYSLEATNSGSTTASNEFRIEEDNEIYEHSLCKKIKIEQRRLNRCSNRKDSILSGSSETYIIQGGINERNTFSDDLFACTSSVPSNISTPSFSSNHPHNNILNNSSNDRNENHNNELYDILSPVNIQTRSNSFDLQSESYQTHCYTQEDHVDNKSGSNILNAFEYKYEKLENLQKPHHKQQVDSEMAISQAKEQEEKRQMVRQQIEQGKMLVEQRMGRLAAEDQVINGFPCCTFTIRCFLKHLFVVNVEDLLSGTWCNKCEENLQKAKEYAEENNGILLSKIYSKTLSFKCSKNHCWESSHQTFKQRWCPQCKKIVKDQFKQYIKEEEAKKQSEYQSKQEEMYQEARRKAMISQSNNESSSEEYKKKVIMAAKQVEREVEKIAEQQANDYIKNDQSNSESPCSFMQLKQMFKIILFPETILQVYYTNLEENDLKTEYRNIARYVHPDKNCHSRAAESFQKLNNFYNLALPKS